MCAEVNQAFGVCGLVSLQVHRLAFVPEEPSAKELKPAAMQAAMAGFVPKALWATEFTEIVWQVKMTGKGVTPVRPVVICSKSFTLQKGHFLQLMGGK